MLTQSRSMGYRRHLRIVIILQPPKVVGDVWCPLITPIFAVPSWFPPFSPARYATVLTVIPASSSSSSSSSAAAAVVMASWTGWSWKAAGSTGRRSYIAAGDRSRVDLRPAETLSYRRARSWVGDSSCLSTFSHSESDLQPSFTFPTRSYINLLPQSRT